MKSFFLSCAYLMALVAAVDRFQIESKASWVSGVAFMGPNWFYGCFGLLFCFVLLSTLHELFSTGDRGHALRHGLFHGGLCIASYAIWRTGMASLNPWCTGGRLCAPREAQTWPLGLIFAFGLALLAASALFKASEPAHPFPSLRRGRRRLPPTYVEK